MTQRRDKLPKEERAALQTPDEFQELGGQAISWATTHRPQLVGGAVAAVIVAGLAVGISYSQRQAAESGALQFRAAHKQFADGKLSDAGTAFDAIVRDRAGSVYGSLGTLYKAHALAAQNDPGAADAYSSFAGQAGVDYLKQAATLGVAASKESSDPQGALEAYAKASELPGPFHAQALLGAARLNESLGHTDDAQRLYAELLKGDDLTDPAVRSLVLSKVPPKLRPQEGDKVTEQ